MIYINRIFERVKPEETYILLDFDRTLTSHDSTVTWGAIEESPLVNPKFAEESLALYNHYRPIETDHTMSFEDKFKHMSIWNDKAVALFNKYHIYEETIRQISDSDHGMKLRKGAEHFLSVMHEMNIPIIMISAGIGTFIEDFLQMKKCRYSNLTIFSNFLIFENGRIAGLQEPNIHSLNKNSINYGHLIEGKRKGILIGDQIEDTKMAGDNDVTNVGFYDPNSHSFDNFKVHFDLMLTEESSFNNIGKTLIKGYK